ncbi:MAG: alpha/beta hydrolase [Pseudomonadota bacterium]
MSAAPYYTDIADGPPAQADWRVTKDGKRLRLAHWKGGSNGTVLLFQGRTEYIEKYGAVAETLSKLGYSLVTCDWRGQGLSPRYGRHYQIGDVGSFSEYQLDVDALLAYAEEKELPKPYFLLAHSLGGAIGLRALHNGLDVAGAVFSAPMWGIQIPKLMAPFANMIVGAYRGLGIEDHLAPGRQLTNYAERQPFAGNALTRDYETYDRLRTQTVARPQLGLGGPSVNWIDLALKEIFSLRSLEAPKVPCLTLYAGAEQIVDNRAIEEIMAHWSDGKAVRCEDAEHEVMMEKPETRSLVWSEISAFLAAHPAANGAKMSKAS